MKSKNTILAACSGVILAASLTSAPVMAEESYTAKEREDGKFCARVKVQHVGMTTITKTKCRTLKEWEEAGYVVSEAKQEM